MNTRSIRNRLLRVERRIRPEQHESFTLEELCRCVWREDKRKFSESVKGSNLSLFLRQFELEDEERDWAGRQIRR